MTVPADDTPGDMNSWFVTLGGPGNLIPSGVLPSVSAFSADLAWPVNAQITVASGGNIASYPVTSITSCSLGGNPPSFTASGIVNGASFAKGGIVPGEIATLFGSNLTSSVGINLTSGLPLVTTFLNVSVMVNDKAVPLFAVDDVNGQEQINFQVPWEVASGPNAKIAVIKQRNHQRYNLRAGSRGTTWHHQLQRRRGRFRSDSARQFSVGGFCSSGCTGRDGTDLLHRPGRGFFRTGGRRGGEWTIHGGEGESYDGRRQRAG